MLRKTYYCIILLILYSSINYAQSPQKCIKNKISKLETEDFFYLKSLDRFTEFIHLMKLSKNQKADLAESQYQILSLQIYLRDNYIYKEGVVFYNTEEEAFWNKLYSKVKSITNINSKVLDEKTDYTREEKEKLMLKLKVEILELNAVLEKYYKSISFGLDNELKKFFKSFNCVPNLWSEMKISEEEKIRGFRDIMHNLKRVYSYKSYFIEDRQLSSMSKLKESELQYLKNKLNPLEESLKRIGAAFIYKELMDAEDSKEWNSELIHEF